MAGCCVMTGRRGAAALAGDMPIPDQFRLDEAAPGFLDAAAEAIADILDNHAARSPLFDPYRAGIAVQQAAFSEQVARIFGLQDRAPIVARAG